MDRCYLICRLIMVIIAMTLVAGCKEKVTPGVAEIKREQITGITLQTIIPSLVDEYYETSGTVQAKTTSSVSGRVMGTVTSIKVKEGDRVSSGQLLLTIDDRDLIQRVKGAHEALGEAEKALAAAEENRNLTEITYQRYKKLYDEKALTRQELDQRETQKKVADIELERMTAAVKRAEAGVGEAEVSHSFTRVNSPVSGLVTEKKIELGSMAVPGMPLFTVEDVTSFHMEINVDEKLSHKIETGMEASVFIGTLNREFVGIVTEIVPSVDPVSRSFLVKLSLRGDGLRNGFYGKVSIPIAKKEVLLVPSRAVVERGQLTGIYTVGNDSVITYRLVRTGRTYGDRVEILSGLNPGEKVVAEGVEKAVDGGIAQQIRDQGNRTIVN